MRFGAVVIVVLALGVAWWPRAVAQGQTIQDRIRARQLASRTSGASDRKGYIDSNGVGTLKIVKRRATPRRRDEGVAKMEPVVVPVALKTVPAGSLAPIVEHYAKQYQVKENLIYAVIECESAFDPGAVSSAGACGLMQLMPGTALEMGVTDIHDPAQNIAGGTQYLAKMLDRFDGDVKLALAAYNAGPEAVAKYDGIPPYSETRGYVSKVMAEFAQYEGGVAPTRVLRPNLYAKRAKSPARSQSTGDAPRYLVHFKRGLKQPAHSVEESGPYYYIRYGRRTYPVRKELVEEIVEAA